ncbi:hypothetical protein LQ327_33105 [Actinomycetospora endophytica]|uniref:ANTAR domain-containing protein n=1 Tax=Actinomycetospora endophytica TaxID=2291215 RepID=A0ABS8PJW5_9PSEU|nr:hypothetical protein [Actinomycetospora endophytica]MCD2198217.1 hypothetical protein [Actinomycetospora endophytica]
MTVLLEPTTTRPDSAVPAAHLDADTLSLAATPTAAVTPEAPGITEDPRPLPDDLAPLVSRARRDRGSALALVHLLLEQGWTASAVSATLAGQVGLTRTQIEALATVRRPRTSASDVADRLVAARHPLARVPHQRRG